MVGLVASAPTSEPELSYFPYVVTKSLFRDKREYVYVVVERVLMKAGQEVAEGAQGTKGGRFTIGLKPDIRYAVYATMGRISAENLRQLVILGLEKKGWNREKIHREYVEYVARCLRRGVKNRFPGGRV